MKASRPGKTAESNDGLTAPAVGGDALVLTHSLPKEEQAQRCRWIIREQR